jgi:hypothetical protein
MPFGPSFQQESRTSIVALTSDAAEVCAISNHLRHSKYSFIRFQQEQLIAVKARHRV